MADKVHANIRVNVGDLKTVVCPCEGIFFEIVNMLKILPAMVSPNGQSTITAVQHFRCVNCGSVYDPNIIIKSAQEDGGIKLVS